MRITTVLLAFVAALVVSSCSPAPMVCTPGASVACTGLGGCAGGQVCNAAGSALGDCVCGTSDAGPADAGGSDTGGGDDAGSDANLPTQGAIRVQWTLRASGSSTTCAAAAGQDHVSVLVTDSGGVATDHSFPCSDAMGVVQGLAFGTYTVAVSIVDGGGAALGAALPVEVTLAASPCDEVIAGQCGKVQDVVIDVF